MMLTPFFYLYILYHLKRAFVKPLFLDNINFTIRVIKNLSNSLLNPSGIFTINKNDLEGFPFFDINETEKCIIIVKVMAESAADGVVVIRIHNGNGVLHGVYFLSCSLSLYLLYHIRGGLSTPSFVKSLLTDGQAYLLHGFVPLSFLSDIIIA
jgi:hypothetical protein